MQSFGDDTLLACLNVEKKHTNLHEQKDSNLEKYFEQSLLSGRVYKNNVNDTKLYLAASRKRMASRKTLEGDESDYGKYFKDSIIFSKVDSIKDSSLVPSTSRENELPPRKNPSSRGTSRRSINAINSKEEEEKRDFSAMVDIVKENDKSSTQFEEDKSCDNIRDEVNNSGVTSAAINSTYDKQCSDIMSLPLCTQDRCKLASWGLPPNILQKYVARGVERMFTWQMECLANQKVLEEMQNLVYSAPTSAGKTLVAEILLIKTVLERKKKVIFILPFVSVVREKMYYFQDLLSDSGIRVEGFMGGMVPPGGFAATHVAIATIEKANSLVNRLMEENDLSSLGAVIIDELHLLGDANRGYLLELLLIKLKYMTIRNDDINIQLIGMSATLPNLTFLAKWLNAELYKTEFRPIPLNEYCKIGTNIYDNKLNLVRNLTVQPELEKDVDNILQLCIETINDGHSVLIFCPTKKWCEKLAEQIAAAFFKLGSRNTMLGEMLKKEINPELIHETLEQLKRSPSGLDNILKSTISFGIAFHHAGLTMDERDIVEGSFRTGSLRVLIATSTLSSGVNLPARRVIIRSPQFGSNLLNTLAYKQMIGRAGRMGKDSAGESILICKPTERNAAASLLSATLDPIESCLNDSTLLIRALLEAVASEVLYTSEDLQLYINCTLLSLHEQSDVQTFSNEAIKFLLDNEFLLLQTTERESRWVATPLGKACLAASVPPREGLFLFEELQKARRCFVLDTELHVIYLVTPLGSGSQIGTVDWMTFHELWNTMSESERRVGRLVGVEERFVMSAIRGIVKPGKLLNIHKRFYSALALHDLVNEVPLNAVCKKYGCCRGVLQTLQQSAATYAGMVTQFCKQLRWDCMELLVSQFQTRLQFGVCRELLDLLRLPMLNGLRARSLYKQGITCVTDLAMTNELNVERALYNALPFESEKEHEGEYGLETEKRNKMRTVFVTGRDGLTPQQAAILLVQEARVLVQKELGLEQLPWEQNEQPLQVNTYIENIKHTISDADKRSETESDVDNSRFMITETPTKNSICNKLASNEDRKHDNSNVHIYIEISKNNISEKENVMESNNQSLNQVVLSSKHSKNNKDSLNLLDINSSNIITNNKQLNNSREKKDYSENSIKIKRNVEGLEKYSQNDNNVPNKKAKTSSQEIKNIDDNVIDKHTSILNEDVKLSYSSSPSLFDDSLNIDTQMYDILEQNIKDIRCSSELKYPELSAGKSNAVRMSPEKSPSSNVNNVQVFNENNAKDVCISTDIAYFSPKNSVLSWDDDSWNYSDGLLKRVIQHNDPDSKNEISKQKIKDVLNTSTSIIPVNMKICMRKNPCNIVATKQTVKIKEKIPEKSKLLKMASKESPVTNVIILKSERRISVDSNKSDSDDVIVDSQHFKSLFSDGKSRVRTQLGKICKTRSQKLIKNVTTEINNYINSPMGTFEGEIANNILEDRREQKVMPKLKEILPRKNLSLTSNCSTDSFIYDSENEVTIDSAKLSAKIPKTKQSSTFDKKVKLKIEIVQQPNNKKDLLNETDWDTLSIVKVANNRATFNLFKREVLKKRSISLALHCDMYVDNTNSVGSKIYASSAERKRKSKKSASYTCGNKEICGAAISWESNIAYYISFNNSQESKISGKEQISLVKELFSDTNLYVKCFAVKDMYKLLYQCLGISAKCRFLDPVIAYWLYTNEPEKSFSEMVTQYFPQGNFIMKRTDSYYNVGPGMDVQSSLPGEFRSAAESVLTWHMTYNIMNKLEELNPVLLHTFRDVETKIVPILACMELSGIAVNLKSLQELSSIIVNEMQSLKTKAYDLAGRTFNLSSSKEVGQVLGLYKDKKISTCKAVLEKCDNPISRLVISWRKLNATKTKIVQPLLNLVQSDPRIHGNCITCTVTGRVSMYEPNLQNVPKDFILEDDKFVVSVRTVFVPALGNVILSADYCQLELRILTHFSQDLLLCQIMRQQGDIFKNIAAKWNNVTEAEVTNEMRQRTKQLCYGMIYGMGVKSLAETLCISQPEAQEFLESFMSTYPGIYKWLNEVLEKAHQDEYVTTLLGRRRQLPDLKNTKSSIRAQAERQAVNTKVQGSAADIVKKAMINIEDKIRHSFPDSAMIFPEAHTTRKLRSNSRDMLQRGGYLILQLHDELLYEVNLTDLKEVAAIIKESMENVCQLTVPLPVRMRVGPTWGNLNDYQF